MVILVTFIFHIMYQQEAIKHMFKVLFCMCSSYTM